MEEYAEFWSERFKSSKGFNLVQSLHLDFQMSRRISMLFAFLRSAHTFVLELVMGK
jgi:hypothetical protein